MRTKLYTFLLVLLSITNSFGQDSLLVGRSYFEDQIYAGVTYNILANKPADLQQKGISSGLHFGFIKDFSLNKEGRLALGLGIGYAYNNYSQNLLIQDKTPEFTLIEEDDFKNKFRTHALELPVEIRIRTSTPTVYKFFRVYLGAKISYVFSSSSAYTSSDNESVLLDAIPYLNKWQYGPYLAIGWGPWNLYAYYNANDLFAEAPVSETVNPNDLRSVKIGLQFYIF